MRKPKPNPTQVDDITEQVLAVVSPEGFDPEELKQIKDAVAKGLSNATTKEMYPEWLYCAECSKRTNLRTCEITRPVLPNTFTPLRDLDRVQWKCSHCEVWQ